ncbi:MULTISPECIES: glycosyltransferase family 2 protein [Citrobacter]|uniref:Glycosyl transferase n=2 Tax=Citrobacter freundii complex TaxID=1344959 RepID=A0A2Z4BVQ1_9ENTR|nr:MULTISPECIES: glycosyltransferase family A protein [Citrobacter]MBS6073713.1 glycosyltransferase family 2 protein [Citrobacter freundii]AWU66740.1 glycosyl transferase [Citrobacter werkmanii]MBC2619949.1 glycosyltransferase family 2 protein [Citrobacter cronae]MBY6247929.1 glycosyltransferase family 2 protein [Citrobacter werkmanii]MBY6252228.1 glycosyltransferase family 2 protein [Citrobacter werkmanii]
MNVFISICIPSYNRAEFLEPLLDSIYNQDYATNNTDFEVIICEDKSPQRDEIKSIIEKYKIKNNKANLNINLNKDNLGYDRNLKNCISSATGKYCMIMGNDDLLADGALSKIVTVLKANPDIVLATRAYGWFKENPNELCDTVRHLTEDTLFQPGIDAIKFFFRRVGVISGFIVNAEKANRLSCDIFDGRLYYQMYLAGMLMAEGQGYYFSDVITLSRDTEAPDFGNAGTEKGIFTPGGYKPEGRIHMVEGLLLIAKHIENTTKINGVYAGIKRDLANYFYPYIRDQLDLPLTTYLKMINDFRKIGFANEKLFYIHAILGYVLKRKGYDALIKYIRSKNGGTPRLGI